MSVLMQLPLLKVLDCDYEQKIQDTSLVNL